MQQNGHGNHGMTGKVRLCPSGCVALSFGPTVVHLPPEEFQNLLAAMLQAADHLGIEAQPTAKAAGRGDPFGGVVPFRIRHED